MLSILGQRPAGTLRIALAVAALLGQPSGLSGQEPPPGGRQPGQQDTAALRRAAEQRLGTRLTQAEILERLRQSGMTRAQIRARLQQMGYDPSLADRYFDSLERGTELPRGEASSTFIEALGRLGLAGRVGQRQDTTGGRVVVAPDSLAEEPESILDDSRDIEVFGLRTFRRAGGQFQPVTFGPVDPGYRVGPGDEILLVLTGDVEAAYSLDVSREGFLFIPDVGQVSVNGLTVEQLQDVLYNRLGRVYSGISRSPNASTRFQVSLGQLRAIQVIVTGDVARPGSYQVSSVAGLFNALYLAGGPTPEGSFRRVEVHRGGRIAHIADLYDFLVRGNGSSDVRLEHNDRIFVPPAGAQVRVEGAVRRAAIYEIRPEEDVRHAISFAGGLRSDALARRIQIDRIMPPTEQRPGFYRQIVDVDMQQLARDDGRVALHDGDVLTVSAVPDLRRNRVWVEGEVRSPGVYEWWSGSTLWAMLDRADGLGEHAYTARAHIYRLVESDGTRRLLQASLERDEAGRPLHDLPLADNDSIVVLSRRQLRTPEFVSIDGFVKAPDTYPLARGMTLRDLILAAEGFSHGAYVLEAEVTRMPDLLQRTNTTAHVIHVSLNTAGAEGNGELRDGAVPQWLPEAGELELRHGDRVFIRRAPGYEPVREILVSGQVHMPGRYVLASRDERLTDIIERAGGLTPQAFPAGIHVVRNGHVVAADLQRALHNHADANNILLAAGDSLHVPAYDPTVVVTGAVNFEARVLYVPGKKLDYYIDQAGGYTENAERRRVTVTYASGERAAVTPRWVGSREPRVQPGSQVFVPSRPEQSSAVNWDQVLGRTAGILSAVATAIFAFTQLK